MRVDDDGRVVGFLREADRPTRSSTTSRTDPAWIDAHGIAQRRPRLPGQHGHLPVPPRDAAATCWRRPTTTTSAARSFPPSIRTRRVQLHLFDGYWEDIGTIRSFYEANLMLAQPNPPFDLAVGHGADLHPRPLPAADAARRRHDRATAWWPTAA